MALRLERYTQRSPRATELTAHP